MENTVYCRRDYDDKEWVEFGVTRNTKWLFCDCHGLLAQSNHIMELEKIACFHRRPVVVLNDESHADILM